MQVATRVGATISVGLADWAEARRAMTVAGISVTLEVLRARKVHMASVARSGVSFNFWSSCMALRPKGVAACPRPSMLALRFIRMAPRAGWSLGIDGKMGRKMGAITRASD